MPVSVSRQNNIWPKSEMRQRSVPLPLLISPRISGLAQFATTHPAKEYVVAHPVRHTRLTEPSENVLLSAQHFLSTAF